MTEYQYFKHLAHGLSEDQADELWRLDGDRWEYLSLVDWRWHDLDEPDYQILPRNPMSLAQIEPDEAAALEAGKHGLLRYWKRDEPRVGVYRTRRLPAVEEVFGRTNEWGPSNDVSHFLFGRPTDPYELTEIDVETAERVIRETCGVSGATDL